MTVLLPSRRWRVRRAPELDPDLVTRWLRPLYPDLALPDAARPEVELSRTADRVLMTSSLYAGAHGVRAVHSEFWDNRRDEPAEEYRLQLSTVVGQLLGLARAGGAQLIVE